MKVYQIAVLAAFFFSDAAFCVPNPQAPVKYISKYPQHPVNLGYGDDYPKYWQNQGYNPAEYPPRVPFYAHPYSNVWKSTEDVQQQQPQQPQQQQSVPVAEEVKYIPPHGFPNAPAPAREAIGYYSGASAARAQAEAAGQQERKNQEQKQASQPSLVKEHHAGGKTSKNLGFTNDGGEGDDGTSFSKVVDTPQRSPVKESDDNWSAFSYDAVSDTLVHHDPYESEAQAQAVSAGGRKTNAMEKIQKLIGNDGTQWHDKRDLNVLGKRGDGWPDHIQTKANKMMKSATAMQDRGQTMIENDPQYKAKQAPPKQAGGAVPKSNGPAPEVKPKEKSIPGPQKGGQKKGGAPEARPKEKSIPGPQKGGQKKDDDPMMHKELPHKQEGHSAKQPKQPKSQRQNSPQQQQQGRQRPARGGKEKKFQDNSPSQGRNGDRPRTPLEKREAYPEPEAGFSGKPPKENFNSFSKSPSGKARPNINQDRPQKKKDRAEGQNSDQGGKGKGNGKKKAVEEGIRAKFADNYVEEVIYEQCEVDVVEESGEGLQKRQNINRKVLPCGPPVTIRRVLGQDQPAPTPAPAAAPIVQAAFPPINQIPDGQIQIQPPHFAPPHVVAPPAVVTQTVERSALVPGPTQYVTQTVEVERFVNVPGPTQVVERPITQIVQRPVTQIVQRPVTQVVERPVEVYHTVVKPYEVQVTETVVPAPVRITQVVERPVEVQVTETVVPAPVRVTQVVERPVEVQVTETVVPAPIRVTQVVERPVEVQVTETVVPAPVRITQTVPVVQTVVETVHPHIKVTPKEKEIITEKQVHGEKEVIKNVPVIKQVPVQKVTYICPICREPEGRCHCGTFNHHNNNGGAQNGGAAADGLSDIPRTAADIEAFFRARLPDEFVAAQ